MDASQYVSNNVTVEFVKASPSKTLVLLSAGAEKVFEGNRRRINFLVEVDGTQKSYVPNGMTLKNAIVSWGKETNTWMGKKLSLSIQMINGKDSVVGMPI